MLRKASAALLLVAIIACGKRGDPHPPVPIIPQAASDLVVTQRGSKIVLSWSYPATTTAGKKLSGVKRVTVYRYVAEPSSPAVSPQQFTKVRQKVESIDEAKLPAASVGAKLTYTDEPPLHAADGKPVRITYAVVTEGKMASSPLSNLAVIAPVAPPAAPTAVAAAAKPEGVVLTWTGAAPAGYNVYRTAAGQPVEDLAVPVNATPVKAMTYTDVPPYGAYDYRATAVAAAGPPRIESDFSSVASTTFKDLLPPPTPANLNALVETSAVRLVWDPVDAPDLAGYKIYRTEGSGTTELKEVGRIPLTEPRMQTNYTDTGANKGISYKYEVTAVDKSGNESAPARTGWVLVPKTP